MRKARDNGDRTTKLKDRRRKKYTSHREPHEARAKRLVKAALFEKSKTRGEDPSGETEL